MSRSIRGRRANVGDGSGRWATPLVGSYIRKARPIRPPQGKNGEVKIIKKGDGSEAVQGTTK